MVNICITISVGMLFAHKLIGVCDFFTVPSGILKELIYV